MATAMEYINAKKHVSDQLLLRVCRNVCIYAYSHCLLGVYVYT